MTESLDLGFGIYECRPSYVLGEAKYGVHLDHTCLDRFVEEVTPHYDRPFGYISNRINDYSRDISLYPAAKRLMPNLICKALVVYDERVRTHAVIEKRFADRTFSIEIFDNLDAAIAWTNERIAKAGSRQHAYQEATRKLT